MAWIAVAGVLMIGLGIYGLFSERAWKASKIDPIVSRRTNYEIDRYIRPAEMLAGGIPFLVVGIIMMLEIRASNLTVSYVFLGLGALFTLASAATFFNKRFGHLVFKFSYKHKDFEESDSSWMARTFLFIASALFFGAYVWYLGYLDTGV